MFKKKLVLATLGMSLGLSGCMYSNHAAPLYSISSNKKSNSRVAPPNNYPSNSIGSIEQPGDRQLVVSNSQVDPYGVPGAPIDNVAIRPNSDPIPEGSTQMSQSARAAAANDPRIKSADQVLTGTQQAGQQQINNASQVSRPSNIINQANAQQTSVSTSDSLNPANPVGSTQTAIPSSSVIKAPASSVPQSATKTLLQEARSSVAAGNYDKAASALERAHRIDPKNPKILYDIAQIRYAQGKYRQSESFASKAANYTKSPVLSKKIWSILSNSRKALGNSTGAAAAAKKAANF